MLLITCPFGLASLLTTELKRLHIRPHTTFPTGCRVDDASRETIIRINLHSRIANKVFLQVGDGIATSFEEAFQVTQKINWQQHVLPQQKLHVHVITKDSILHAERSIQSVVHKAIITQLTGDNHEHRTTSDNIPPLEIYIYLENNHIHICKNTSGDSLHKRGRRQDQGIAPIKENLAVATLLSASWPFQQALRDPCCGSGTLLIEAARLARNIAPGNQRSFAFQSFPDYPQELFTTLLTKANRNTFSKDWTIIGSDHDDEMLAIARKNAQAAGVDDIIEFVHHDVLQPNRHPSLQGPTTLICNPPYDQRMDTFATDAIHQRLAELTTQDGRHGAIISGYDQAEKYFPLTTRKRKETRQGKEQAYIWIYTE